MSDGCYEWEVRGQWMLLLQRYEEQLKNDANKTFEWEMAENNREGRRWWDHNESVLTLRFDWSSLTLSEVVQVRQKNISRVDASETLKFISAHLTQLLPIHAVKQRHVHVWKRIFLHGPIQPLLHMLCGPHAGICAHTQTNTITWILLID